MEILRMRGGRPLSGTVAVDGAKNAVLPMMAASLMIEEPVLLYHVSRLSDVAAMAKILGELGAAITWEGDAMRIDASSLTYRPLREEPMKALRASNLLWGSLLDRFGKAELPYPGGCRIGLRPMDLHLRGLKALGVVSEDRGGSIISHGENRVGTTICLDYPSVGATENIVMAAVRAKGRTVLKNAAREPEVADFCRFLNTCGAAISGVGGDTLSIEGVQKLKGGEYTVLPDRIVGGTLLLAALITAGDVILSNVGGDQLGAVASKLAETGAEVTLAEHSIRLRSMGRYHGADLRTMPYPGFPTDLQPPFTAAMVKAKGASVIREEIFENRLAYCSELKKLGADIAVGNGLAVVRGGDCLSGAEVEATDLRGGAALILAGLAADGTTTFSGVNYVDRGYHAIEKTFSYLGAEIERLSL